MKLSDEEKAVLREVFTTRPDAPCADCGGYHLRSCPRVRRQVWIGQGSAAGVRTEVEYWPSWDESNTVWPEEVFDSGEGDE